MFSFHKPKVYRSSTGCCICKAKSSSSRFTDSKKYEEDFIECFQLSSRRQGEICNACVLLVKRWKKLPDGPKRNWRHVVDARAGPGMKSMTKFKSKQKKQLMLMEHLGENKGRHHDGNNRRDGDDFEREFSPTLSDKSDDMDIVDYTNTMAGDDGPPNGNNTNSGANEMDGIHGGSGESSPRLSHSPTGSECEDNGIIGNTVGVLVGSRRRKASKVVLSRRRRRQDERSETSVSAAMRVSVGFIDLDYWTKESICCGVVFRGKNGEVLVDVGRGCRLKPCNISLQQQKVRPHSVAASIASAADQRTVLQSSVVVQSSNSNGDNSSDSGYDDGTVGVGNAVDGAAMDSGALRAANETMHQTVLQLASVRRKPTNVNGIAGRAAVSAGSNCDD